MKLLTGVAIVLVAGIAAGVIGKSLLAAAIATALAGIVLATTR